MSKVTLTLDPGNLPTLTAEQHAEVYAIVNMPDEAIDYSDDLNNIEVSVEKEIQDKGLTAARITPTHLDSRIQNEEYYTFPNSTLTICCLTLKNGFNVTGESACANPANFDLELGQRIARTNAREKIWALEGYLLKQRLYEETILPLPQ